MRLLFRHSSLEIPPLNLALTLKASKQVVRVFAVAHWVVIAVIVDLQLRSMLGKQCSQHLGMVRTRLILVVDQLNLTRTCTFRKAP
ncbi:hypothetical protein D9M71_841040 [compost metagenome]